MDMLIKKVFILGASICLLTAEAAESRDPSCSPQSVPARAGSLLQAGPGRKTRPRSEKVVEETPATDTARQLERVKQAESAAAEVTVSGVSTTPVKDFLSVASHACMIWAVVQVTIFASATTWLKNRNSALKANSIEPNFGVFSCMCCFFSPLSIRWPIDADKVVGQPKDVAFLSTLKTQQMTTPTAC
eukprot:TRINITY_DN59639_c0_g1_i1.p1 TRINITY_DN59639_c0_g1~~TRINITY_DN59639_c0_g1_i1.p1  ORF type:complete len:188 (-),score=32.69 TRINITY_DN59639_c0_g1_i1:294-857(-)